MPRILVTGALGQIGVELIPLLRSIYGAQNVVASDVLRLPPEMEPYCYCDVTDISDIERVVVEHNIEWVIHNACVLSAAGEANPSLGLRVNLIGSQNVLEVARKHHLRVLSPSSIAAFGPSTPRVDTPDLTIQRPTTVYGIAKVHLELLGEYYHRKCGLDFRCLRFPGIISWKRLPVGGTTDFAVYIYLDAIRKGSYDCFLRGDTKLPLMYMDDCLKSIIRLLQAPRERLTQCVYNVAGFTADAETITRIIQRRLPNFVCNYKPDHRQQIAESWPESINDECARRDWDWHPDFSLEKMSNEMLDRMEQLVRENPNLPN